MPTSRARWLVRNLFLAVAYYGVARISLLFAYHDLQITAVWLPSGIALAAVVVYGPAMLPGILLGDFVAGVTFGTSPAVALWVAIAGALEALVGARLLPNRRTMRSTSLFGVPQVIAFVFRGAVLAPLASVIVGAGALFVADTVRLDALPRAAAVWWTGDLIGILLVMPVVLLVLATGRPPSVRSRWDWAPFTVTLGATGVIFLHPAMAHASGQALSFLVFPLLGWCAFALSASLLAATNLAVAVIALAGTALGLGPYAMSGTATDIWYLQAFVAAFAITSLMLRGAIEDQRRSTRRASEMEEHFRSAADTGGHLILVLRRELDPKSGTDVAWVSYANRHARSLFRAHAASGSEIALARAFPELSTGAWAGRLDAALRERRAIEGDVELGRSDTVAWFRCTAVPMDDRMIVTLLDITRRRAAEDRLAQLAVVDPLTGLANRTALNEHLGREIVRARADGSSVAVLFVDLDDFRLINDSLGHHVGDDVLVEVARRLERVVGDAGVVGRLGGDEFIVVAPGSGWPEPTGALVRRLIAALSVPCRVRGSELVTSCSIGVAMSGIAPEDGVDLIRYADTAMYEAKRSGGRRAMLYDREIAARALRRNAVEEALHGAVERGEFSLHYQPIVALGTGNVVGAEALLRWTHATLGSVPPAEFIRIAEDTGQIGGIGGWVFERVAQQAREWNEAGCPALRIGVNLSARQLDDALPATIADCLARSGLARPWLDLEVTESSVLDDFDVARRVLGELRAQGVRIAIDDFGSGYSALGYLKRLPVDVAKLDRSLVEDVGQSAMNQRLVGSIVSLCKVLGVAVVAEGVETDAQRIALRDVGCDEYQGFLLSRPLPPTEFAARFLDALRTPARSGETVG